MSKKKLGLIVILAPFAGLIITLAAWMLIAGYVSGSNSGDALAVMRLANVALGLLGLISVLGIPVGLVVGIILMASSSDQPPVERVKSQAQSESPAQAAQFSQPSLEPQSVEQEQASEPESQPKSQQPQP